MLAAEGDKFVRLAAFDAALLEIRSGNEEGAAEAARKAAAETRIAWETGHSLRLMKASNVTTQTMSLTHGQLTNKILADQAKVKSKQRAIQREWESYQDNYDDFRDYDDDGSVIMKVARVVGPCAPVGRISSVKAVPKCSCRPVPGASCRTEGAAAGWIPRALPALSLTLWRERE